MIATLPCRQRVRAARRRGHSSGDQGYRLDATLRRVTSERARNSNSGAADHADRASVAIVGAGTMGAGIAQVALEGGWRVALFDSAAEATDRARSRIRDGLLRRAEKAGDASPAAVADGRLALLRVAPALADAV